MKYMLRCELATSTGCAFYFSELVEQGQMLQTDTFLSSFSLIFAPSNILVTCYLSFVSSHITDVGKFDL